MNCYQFDLRIEKNEALLTACTRGKFKTVQCLCEDFGLTVSELRANNNKALELACVNGMIKVVKYLRKAGLSFSDVWEVRNRI